MPKFGKLNLNVFSARDIEKENVPWKISDVLFTYVFVFALSLIAVGILFLTRIDADTSLFQAIFQIIISFATVGIIYVIISKKYEVPFFQALGISAKDTPGYLWKGILVTLILIISTSVVSVVFAQFVGVPKQNPYGNLPEDKLRMLSVLAVLVAPFVEETFFRGFMQPALIKNLGAFGGILITALIFGISHTQYLAYSPDLVAVTVIGLILGITRYQTGSIMPGIFAHLLNNLAAAMSLYR